MHESKECLKFKLEIIEFSHDEAFDGTPMFRQSSAASAAAQFVRARITFLIPRRDTANSRVPRIHKVY